MSNTDLKIYRMAVCLYPDNTSLDYQGVIEILCSTSIRGRKQLAPWLKNPPNFAINPEYLSHNHEPVQPTLGPALVPTMTYHEAKGTQFDIILIPGGTQTDLKAMDQSIFEFVKRQGPGAKHILTVCTGSWVLSYTGLLNGKHATTNKAAYKMIVEDTKHLNITWVPQARWVVNDDKHIWTSSGVTAGMDLANSFLVYLSNEKFAEEVRGVIEFSANRGPNDDEFAAYYGLV
ncbi:dj-1 family protein [Moniliophthora roreri MCA 2997]|uniref:Dj-1 family protein n=2 Tax=Moniliophthora roreri TaxID=221103 RepID=V2WUA4_MONRO|nr:dj-1 family protein [Moniliophthora roreri MCA 2997]KAI3614413.1 dj-1 family protein [Moniliophthora roreri]